MDAAHTIRDAVLHVNRLRQATADSPALGLATAKIKRFQARRFAGTYADLLRSGRFAGASRFFLDELYGDKDYADRDAQFSRIAGALQTLFPDQVVDVAVSLAKLHLLTEELDQAMALALLDAPLGHTASDEANYIGAWRQVDRQADRDAQLAAVMAVGQELAALTRKRGLRTMLKMMRRPAAAAGLSALQRFLESGFDTFASMADDKGAVDTFLALIQQRESTLIHALFFTDSVTCETHLQRLLVLA